MLRLHEEVLAAAVAEPQLERRAVGAHAVQVAVLEHTLARLGRAADGRALHVEHALDVLARREHGAHHDEAHLAADVVHLHAAVSYTHLTLPTTPYV